MDASAGEAARRRPADVIESLLYVHSADLSPDGTRCAWASAQTRDGAEVFELYVVDLASNDSAMIARGRDPVWAPDGQRLAFLAPDAATVRQVFIWDAVTGAIAQATELGHGVVGGGKWSPDGRYVAFTALPEPRDRTVPYRVTRIVPWRDGAGLVDDSAADVWVHDVVEGRSRRLTDDDCVNTSPTWLSQTGEVAFIASWHPELWSDVSVVRAVSLEGELRDLMSSRDVSAIADVPSSVGQLAVSAGGHFRDTQGELVILLHDGSVESRSDQLGIDVIGDVLGDLPVPFADLDARILILGDDAIIRVQQQDRLVIHRIRLRGDQATEEIASDDGCLYPLAVGGDTLLFGRGDLLTPPDLWVRNLVDGDVRRVTDTAASTRSDLRATVVERFWAQAEGGPQVQCKLMRPQDESGPLPTVLIVHGGPFAAFGETFVTDAALLCEAGFAVLLVNPRGSRGYGVEFSTALHGRWGEVDYQDLMAAVDHAIDAGWTDPDRLGVGGVSYGGFMTAWVIGHTHRFKAAMCENGVTNFVSMYGTSDIGLSFIPESLGGTPYENPEGYARSSPITTAHTAVTPTLVIVGEQDHRCPPEQNYQLYSVLKRAGCVAEMLVLPDSSHDASVHGSVATRRAQNEAFLEWMERYV